MEKEGEKDVVENKREDMNEEKKEENNDDIKGSQNPSEQVHDENKEEVKKSEVEKESDKKDNDERPVESSANKIEWAYEDSIHEMWEKYKISHKYNIMYFLNRYLVKIPLYRQYLQRKRQK